MRSLLLLVVVLDLLSAAETGATTAQPAADGPLTHVVLCWLKQPGDSAGRQAVIAASQSLGSLPGVADLRVGEPIPSPRPIVDASFDVGISMRFEDQAALEAYLVHPQHVQAVETVLKPLVARIVVYDIRER